MVKRLVWILLLLAPGLCGCVAVAAASVAGLGFVQFQRNQAEQDFFVSFGSAWNAALDALRRFGLTCPRTERTGAQGTIQQDDLFVQVQRHPEGFTRVSVRVGTFDTGEHRRRAQVVMDEIQRLLQRSSELDAWKTRVDALLEDESTAARTITGPEPDPTTQP